MDEINLETLRTRGFQVIRGVLTDAECDQVQDELESMLLSGGDGQRDSASYCLRNLLSRSAPIRDRVSREPFLGLAKDVLGDDARAVKAIYFDKNHEANWVVPWHQDLTIAVQEKHELEGFTNWTVKENVWHVQPPAHILESQVTLRLHLDDCSASNGALRVVPGSHSLGRLDHAEEARLREEIGEVCCEAKRGDVLLMSPLILHASSKAMDPSHRRIVHVEYSAASLPAPLVWRG